MSSANISSKATSKFKKYFLLLVNSIAFFLVLAEAADARIRAVKPGGNLAEHFEVNTTVSIPLVPSDNLMYNLASITNMIGLPMRYANGF